MKKIIWAVDAFQEDMKPVDNCIRILKSYQKKYPKLQIQPVYILSDGLLRLSVPMQSLKDNFLEPSRKSLKKIVSRDKSLKTEEPEVIVQSLSSSRDAVKGLISFAKKSKADLIVTATHARKGVKRLFMGSFAETLVYQASLPVMIVGPKLADISKKHAVLYPTDFSKSSHHSFKKLTGLFKDLDLKTTLFHSVGILDNRALYTGIGLAVSGWIPYTDFTDIVANKTKISNSWVNEAKKNRVKVDSVIKTHVLNVPDSILDEAKTLKASMIALNAQSGPITSAVLGSTTRILLRNSELPILILKS